MIRTSRVSILFFDLKIPLGITMNKYLLFSILSVWQALAFSFEICPLEEVYESACENGAVMGNDAEKVYINQNAVVYHNGFPFLRVDRKNYALLPLIQMDNRGLFVNANTAPTQLAGYIQVTSNCPNCGRQYLGWCSNKNCPGNERIKQHEKEKKAKTEAYKKSKNGKNG